MSRRRFTDRQLFRLRNQIPIRQVIESLLALPTKMDQGTFRFCCPLCAGFNTAVNPKTNLARCFQCEKNFNPIDMVMIVRQTDFVETVTLLLNYKTKPSSTGKINPGQRPLPEASQSPMAGEPRKELVAIGDILADFVGKTRKIETELPESANLPSSEDIAKLERTVDTLTQIIHQLKKLLKKQA